MCYACWPSWQKYTIGGLGTQRKCWCHHRIQLFCYRQHLVVYGPSWDHATRNSYSLATIHCSSGLWFYFWISFQCGCIHKTNMQMLSCIGYIGCWIKCDCSVVPCVWHHSNKSATLSNTILGPIKLPTSPKAKELKNINQEEKINTHKLTSLPKWNFKLCNG